MKIVANITLGLIVIINFSNCSTAQKLQQNIPYSVDNVYYQHWVAGIQGGGSGINLFIPLKSELPKSIELDSVYFRGKASKLEVKPDNPKLFIGRFKSAANKRHDIIMSGNAEEEYGNQMPIKNDVIPFELNDNECVISYKDNGKVKYFKIESVVEKQAEYLPSVPPKPN